MKVFFQTGPLLLTSVMEATRNATSYLGVNMRSLPTLNSHATQIFSHQANNFLSLFLVEFQLCWFSLWNSRGIDYRSPLTLQPVRSDESTTELRRPIRSLLRFALIFPFPLLLLLLKVREALLQIIQLSPISLQSVIPARYVSQISQNIIFWNHILNTVLIKKKIRARTDVELI